LNEPYDENLIFPLDMEMTILELADGGKITVGDALKYINLDIVVPPIETPKEEGSEDEEEEFPKETDHPEVPKSLCQDCLDKLQSMYEFKYRCEENREYLKNHVKELADAREAAERAARDAIVAELQFDINNIDSLPDKLIPKQDMKQKRNRKPKDPNDSGSRRKKPVDRTVIIAEDSQVDSAIYIRKMVTTPEKSPDQKAHSSKRKSKHVVIEDIAVGEKPKPPKYDRTIRKKEPLCDINSQNESIKSEADTSSTSISITEAKEPVGKSIRDEEPIFEDDEEEESKAKRPKRTRK
jgi:hypothetical protein